MSNNTNTEFPVIKYPVINGWTKAEIIEVIENRGTDGQAQDQSDLVRNGRPACTYRNEEGHRCAVGAFFPKAGLTEYDGFEGSAAELIEHHPDVAFKLPLCLAALIGLQRLHDMSDIVYPEDANTVTSLLVDWVNNHVEDE